MKNNDVFTGQGQISLVRAKNSINGNPAFNVVFITGDHIIQGKTAHDASFCYCLSSTYGTFKKALVKYHKTQQKRKVVFDDITLL